MGSDFGPKVNILTMFLFDHTKKNGFNKKCNQVMFKKLYVICINFIFLLAHKLLDSKTAYISYIYLIFLAFNNMGPKLSEYFVG